MGHLALCSFRAISHFSAGRAFGRLEFLPDLGHKSGNKIKSLPK